MISTVFSIRKSRLAIVALVTGMSLGTGCVQMANRPAEPLSQEPLLVDDAMQLRDWEPSTAYYRNGDVVAGPTLFPLVIDPNASDCKAVAFEPVLFVGQAIVSPITALVVPAWKEVTWTGVTIDPTYTAQPPLPDDTMPLVTAQEAE